MADAFHFEKQFLKFVLICVLFCEFSYPCAQVSNIKKENLKGKKANNTAVPQLCRRPPHYIPLFVLEMYRKIATKKGISANTKLTIRSIPGKRLSWWRPSVHFNLSALTKSITLVRAKLYMLVARSKANGTQEIKALVYNIFNDDTLASRCFSLNESGWIPFEFKSVSTVMDWIRNPKHNRGIEIKFSRGMTKLDLITAAKLLPCINKSWLTLYYYDTRSTITDFEKLIYGGTKKKQRKQI